MATDTMTTETDPAAGGSSPVAIAAADTDALEEDVASEEDAAAFAEEAAHPMVSDSRLVGPSKPFPFGAIEWESATLSLRERLIMRVVDQLSDKPDWETKVHDEAIVKKWKAELDELVRKDKKAERRKLKRHWRTAIADFLAEEGKTITNGRTADDLFSSDSEQDDEASDATSNPSANTDDKLRDPVYASDQYPATNAQGLTYAVGFSDQMWTYALAELRHKATSSSQGVAVFDASASVYKLDGLPRTLASALSAAVKPLEDVPPEMKDWHPGSDGQVLDLVHPSLWPVVYGRTRSVNTELDIDNCLDYMGGGEVVQQPQQPNVYSALDDSQFQSRQFQWLPAEVQVGEDGKARYASYINNIHPSNKAMYTAIEDVTTAALPLWRAAVGRVMTYVGGYGVDSDLDPANPNYDRLKQFANGKMATKHARMLLKTFDEDSREDEDGNKAIICLTPDACEAEKGEDSYQSCVDISGPVDYPTLAGVPLNRDCRLARSIWYEETHRVNQPEPPVFDVDMFPAITPITVPSSTPLPNNLQVIVKIASIELTPEKPSYPGGSWHLEGMMNEHIAATALFYYDQENITPSRLAFRSVVGIEHNGGFYRSYMPEEFFREVYGGEDMHPRVMYIGSAETRENRLLVFPNVYEHRVSPFELVDSTKPGHRKILALFLVDPRTRITSSADVPPQQRHWLPAGANVSARLPPELSDIVYDNLDDVPYGTAPANQYRYELMEERKGVNTVSFMTEEDHWEERWNFCEH